MSAYPWLPHLFQVHFIPGNVTDVEGALSWLNTQTLAPFADLKLKV